MSIEVRFTSMLFHIICFPVLRLKKRNRRIYFQTNLWYNSCILPGRHEL